MKKSLETEIKVGIFVSLGVALIMVTILVMGGSDSIFTKKHIYTSHFASVDGLIAGAKVILGGVPVGIVDEIGFDAAQRNIKVQFAVDRNATEWIRKNSTVEIATQGMLGDKYLSIEMGSPDQATVPPGSDIPNRPAQDLTQFLSSGDQLLLSLNNAAKSLDRILKGFEAENRSGIFFKGLSNTAKNLSAASEKMDQQLDKIQLKAAIGNLNQILEKINNGTGTVGALINDPSLYDEVKALFGGANRNRVIRNLIRQTVKDTEKPAKTEN